MRRLGAVLTLVATFGLASAFRTDAAPTAPQGQRASDDAGFQRMLDRVDAAQLELQNGKAEPFKALWSRRDDTTLAGGFGGGIEKGWEPISRRLDWVATQFSKATHRNERTASNVSGDLGYVVQMEHIRDTVPGQAKESTRDYRVTMVFRREPQGWRLVHRQADSNLVKQ